MKADGTYGKVDDLHTLTTATASLRCASMPTP